MHFAVPPVLSVALTVILGSTRTASQGKGIQDHQNDCLSRYRREKLPVATAAGVLHRGHMGVDVFERTTPSEGEAVH
jgi:hypothetical protein